MEPMYEKVVMVDMDKGTDSNLVMEGNQGVAESHKMRVKDDWEDVTRNTRDQDCQIIQSTRICAAKGMITHYGTDNEVVARTALPDSFIRSERCLCGCATGHVVAASEMKMEEKQKWRNSTTGINDKLFGFSESGLGDASKDYNMRQSYRKRTQTTSRVKTMISVNRTLLWFI